jgi:signal transduction histidine kinase
MSGTLILATHQNKIDRPLGWTQMLSSRRLNAAKTVEALETIERDARAQNRLVDNLLDISRLQQDGEKVQQSI